MRSNEARVVQPSKTVFRVDLDGYAVVGTVEKTLRSGKHKYHYEVYSDKRNCGVDEYLVEDVETAIDIAKFILDITLDNGTYES